MSTNHIFDLTPPAGIPIHGTDETFPVNRIFCVGRNYASHAREMGSNPDREPPFFFAKPADAIQAGCFCHLSYPPKTQDLHHEVELVIGLKEGGRNIPQDEALDHIYGVAVGLDFTRRDLQSEAKKTGRPWDMAKGFDDSAVIGPMQSVKSESIPQSGFIRLSVDGQQRQNGNLDEMIWSISEVVAELSSYLTLQPGDLIFTGTPEGVSAVKPDDIIRAEISDLPILTVKIEAPA